VSCDHVWHWRATTYRLTFHSASELDVVLVGYGALGSFIVYAILDTAEHQGEHFWGEDDAEVGSSDERLDIEESAPRAHRSRFGDESTRIDGPLNKRASACKLPSTLQWGLLAGLGCAPTCLGERVDAPSLCNAPWPVPHRRSLIAVKHCPRSLLDRVHEAV